MPHGSGLRARVHLRETTGPAGIADDEPAGSGAAVTVTHPAHPFRGRRLNVRAVRGQGLAQVLVCEVPDGGLVTVLRSWTNQLPAAPPAAGCPADRGGPRRRSGSDGGPTFRVSAAALRRLRTAVEETVGRLAGIEAPAEEH